VEITIPEAARDVGEAGESLEEGHDARVAEAQGGHALTALDRRALEAVQSLLRQDALVTDALDFEELPIDLLA
jgi:hypothetical protein